jgi:muramoyltetrapeptide carboxypeptidase
MTAKKTSIVAIRPQLLRAGDKVRFVSPASTPQKEAILLRARTLESWGLEVDFGKHAFDESGHFAGTDDERLSDLNEALNDPKVRAIFATRGGQGSYRIADRIDFTAARRDPKFLIGFSDITALHLSIWKNCKIIGVHGALAGNKDNSIRADSAQCLRDILMVGGETTLHSRPGEITAALTTKGMAEGRLIGGNLSMVATAAGWALPKLKGAILLLEAVNITVGQVDRFLSMLRKAGHLEGIQGIALGQFTGFDADRSYSILDVLRDHITSLNVPILGGVPLGHGDAPLSTRVGSMARLDCAFQTLTVAE